jgi:hypothetical protein
VPVGDRRSSHLTLFSTGAGRGTLDDVDAVREALVVGTCVLISLAALASLVIVWRDDHRGVDR